MGFSYHGVLLFKFVTGHDAQGELQVLRMVMRRSAV